MPVLLQLTLSEVLEGREVQIVRFDWFLVDHADEFDLVLLVNWRLCQVERPLRVRLLFLPVFIQFSRIANTHVVEPRRQLRTVLLDCFLPSFSEVDGLGGPMELGLIWDRL